MIRQWHGRSLASIRHIQRDSHTRMRSSADILATPLILREGFADFPHDMLALCGQAVPAVHDVPELKGSNVRQRTIIQRSRCYGPALAPPERQCDPATTSACPLW